MKDEIFTVKIDKLLYEGKSLARVNNMPVFFEGGCPEDVVKIKIVKINKRYMIGEIMEIIEPSPKRIKPFCPLHKVCGSCNWQYVDYNEQLIQKKNIVFETLKNITGEEYEIQDVIPSPKIMEYRCKVQYPVQEVRSTGRLISGYYKRNSHDLINIKYCPIQPDIINEINEYIKNEAGIIGISGYDEKTHSGLLKHIIYRISSDLKQILIIFVINSDKKDDKFIKLAELIKAEYDNITGICLNYNTKKTNVILSEKTEVIAGRDYYEENLEGIKYKISANSFFQVNPYSAVNIFNKLKEIIQNDIENPVILDAYSGVSSIGIWLSLSAKKVVCVEEVKSASNNALDNIKLNEINNVEIINGDASVIFDDFIKGGTKFDVSIIDPPRKGSTPEAIKNLSKMTDKSILYVSCNPSTLARDIVLFKQEGFKPIYVQPVDMFPHTYHIETIVLLKKYTI